MTISVGTEFISEGVRKQPKSYLEYVAALISQKGALKNYRQNLRKSGATGNWRRWYPMPTTGKSGGKEMTNRCARGFQMLLLNSEQQMRIRAKEQALPQGRCLTPWEISRLLGVQTGAKVEEQITQMEKLEEEFNRQ